MQGVHVAPAFNDENSTRGPLLHSAFKENAASFQAPAKQGSALKSARKAFGNITNTRSDAAAQQQPGGTVVKRRAFGDITNSTIKQQPGAASAKKADSFGSQLKPSSSKAPAATALAAAEAAGAVAWWETAEPERPAGKSWEQLLADKEKQEDAEIERSVQQLLSGFRDLTARCFQVLPGANSEEDDLLPLGPPPPLPSHSSSRDSTAKTSSADCPFGGRSVSGCIGEMLPDVELPSTDSEDYAAADADEAAWPDLQQTSGAPLAAQSTSTGGVGSLDAAASGAGQDTVQQQGLKHADADMSCSPARPTTGGGGAVVGLKSPEVLPW